MVKDDIKERVVLSEYIEKYINLDKTGKGVCPFHQNDTDPSLSINDGKAFWSCFGCGKGGDIFNFVMLYHRMNFADSVKHLSQYLGIEITDSKSSLYLRMLTSLSESFIETNDVKFKSYIEDERKLDFSIMKKMQVGFVSNSFILSSYNKDLLEEIGYVNPNGFKYNNCISFPFMSNKQVYGFNFKPLYNTTRKYLYVENSFLFKKGNFFFGYDLLKEYIINAGYVILVEGVFDCLRCIEKGYLNTLAVGGTGLSEVQAEKIKRICKNVILLYDGDSAGRRGALKSAGVLFSHGLDVNFMCLPDKVDPDDFLKTNSLDLLEVKDIVKFFKDSFSKSDSDLLFSIIGQDTDLNRIEKNVSEVTSIYPNIPKSLIMSKLSNGFLSDEGGVYKQYNHNFVNEEIIKGWIYGDLTQSRLISLSLTDEYLSDFNYLLRIKEDLGFLDVSKVGEKYLKYFNIPVLNKSELAITLANLRFKKSDLKIKDIGDIIEFKRAKFGGF